jgi:hypothetical protein
LNSKAKFEKPGDHILGTRFGNQKALSSAQCQLNSGSRFETRCFQTGSRFERFEARCFQAQGELHSTACTAPRGEGREAEAAMAAAGSEAAAAKAAAVPAGRDMQIMLASKLAPRRQSMCRHIGIIIE